MEGNLVAGCCGTNASRSEKLERCPETWMIVAATGFGLSLASEKVSEEVIVIDPVERPSEN